MRRWPRSCDSHTGISAPGDAGVATTGLLYFYERRRRFIPLAVDGGDGVEGAAFRRGGPVEVARHRLQRRGDETLLADLGLTFVAEVDVVVAEIARRRGVPLQAVLAGVFAGGSEAFDRRR